MREEIEGGEQKRAVGKRTEERGEFQVSYSDDLKANGLYDD